jgi:penicillin amidase
MPFAHRHGAGYRAVYDLADLDNSRFMIATGQSGNPLSPHYGDLVRPWRDGAHFRISRGKDDLARPALGRLALEPR